MATTNWLNWFRAGPIADKNAAPIRVACDAAVAHAIPHDTTLREFVDYKTSLTTY